MRVTHVVATLNRGGMERVVIDLCQGLQHAGVDCDVICIQERGQLAPELDELGVSVTALPQPSTRGRGLLELRRLLIQRAPTVIHSHNAVAGYYAAFGSIALPVGFRINTRHGAGAGVSRRVEAMYRVSCVMNDRVAVVSQDAADSYVARHVVSSSKVVVVPNGIRTNGIDARNPAARNDLLKELGAPGQTTTVFGAVGRLNPLKDHSTMLAAFERVVAAEPEAILIVVGDGPVRSELERQVDSRKLRRSVFLVGDRSDVPRLLAGFDAFVMSSISEGYSLALVEAAAAALPIVATQVGGNAEIVSDRETGFLVPAKDSQALATSMLALVNDPTEATAMGARGRRWALANGSVESMCQRYLDLYQAS